jgi:aryl-alcohol dehydrogenase-like predicted oxidoreductase
MNFGTSGGVASCDEPEATQIVDAFLDAGGSLVDTADGYTGGQSEQIVGRAIKNKRDSVVLATKAFLPQGPGPNDRGLSRLHLTRALEASLGRLGTDYIDLYQCHQWDDSTPVEETLATLDGFIRSGKVRYIGCSNFTAAQLMESLWTAQRLGATPFVSLQPQYSLLARGIEAEILPICQRYGLGTLAWSPLGGGVLTGRYRRDLAPDADTRVLTIADQVVAIAAELDTRQRLSPSPGYTHSPGSPRSSSVPERSTNCGTIWPRWTSNCQREPSRTWTTSPGPPACPRSTEC